jgi:hypothetical protein
MVAVKEITWEEASAPGFEQTTRQAWREAVAEIADKAKAKLPECSGRVDAAVKIVLAGDVELLPDGTVRVASQSSGTTAYHIVHGHCDCRDYEKAPHQFCKHRLSAAIARRAQELMKAKLPAEAAQSQPVPTVPLPEVPVSITLKATLHGHEVMVTLRGVDFASVKAQVEQASEWLKLQAPAQRQPARTEQGWCGKHGVAMKLNHGKNGSTWYSHMTVDGWCQGR